MTETFDEIQIARLLKGIQDLEEAGDIESARTVVWIAYTLVLTHPDLPDSIRVDLASVAARAACQGSIQSLALLVTRIVDPILAAAPAGEVAIAVGQLEELNELRRTIGKATARYPVGAVFR